VIVFQYKTGQTPIDPDEKEGLIPTHLASLADLNAWEQHNIVHGAIWGERACRRREVLDEGFVRQLHKRMLGQTWAWAGTFRKSDKSIGVPWEQIAVRLSQLLENTKWQRDNKVLSDDALAVEFHFRLVSVHPFPNGNGRHSRMMADVLAMSLGREPFTWGAYADLTKTGESRARYLQGIYDARDTGKIDSLLAFARS
jgi:Fic-DOC domain mobile mystery protein B